MRVGVWGGNWGLVLGVLLARAGHRVRVFDHPPERARMVARRRRHPIYDFLALPDGLEVVAEVAMPDVELALFAPPAEAMRGVASRSEVPRDAIVVSASKGLEPGTRKRMSEVLAEELPGRAGYACLSGPTIAREVAQGIPTAIVVASRDDRVARLVQSLLMSENFRAYTNDDLMGVELGGVSKNVIAIAAGVCDGLGLGANTKAAILTRGLAEMTRLGVACGARAATFAGLSGLGDLAVTCMSPYSRNRRLGEAVGRGVPPEEALASLGEVAEGYHSVGPLLELARERGVEMPISERVQAVLHGGESPRHAVRKLMRREARAETEDWAHA